MNWYIILVSYNLVVFLIYGLDKLFAVKKHHRISERTLLMFAFLMGAAGAIFGMTVFCHKTRKMKFRLLVPLFVIINTIAVIYLTKYGCKII